MTEKAKSIWITDNNNQKLIPFTTSNQVLMSDGSRMDKAWDTYKETVLNVIPKDMSDLTNNLNFQTKEEVDNNIKENIQNIQGVTYSIPPTGKLPSVGEVGVIYFIPNNSLTTNQNYYDEFIWLDVENRFEHLGSKEIDTSNFITKKELTEQLPTKLPADGGNSSTVGGYSVVVLSEANYQTEPKIEGTLYFVYDDKEQVL